MTRPTNLKILIKMLGEAPADSLPAPLAKECQDFTFVDDAGALRFLRDLVDKIVYSTGGLPVLNPLSFELAKHPPESEEQRSSRRDALDFGRLGHQPGELSSRKSEPMRRKKPLVLLSQEQLLTKLYDGTDDNAYLDAALDYIGSRLPDGVALIGSGGAGDPASIDALLEALEVERLQEVVILVVIGVSWNVKSVLKKRQAFVERAETELAKRGKTAEELEVLLKHIR